MSDVIENQDEAGAYVTEYSEDGFWGKLASYAKKAGREVVDNALILYFSLQDPAVPTRFKAVIYGALGYFIMPVDVIPDVVPVVGFTDDFGILASAITAVAIYVSPETKQKAKGKTAEWFD